MSCSTNTNKSALAATRCGINRLVHKTLAAIPANKDAISFGAAAGSLAFTGKLLGDRANYTRRALLSAAYRNQLQGVAQLAKVAANVNPELRPALLPLIHQRLDGLRQSGYAGLPASMQQRFIRQHQIVDDWLIQMAAAFKEEPLAREFVTGAARAGEFGMKGFTTPAPAPPSTRAALQTGLLIGATAAALFAANKIVVRRQQAATRSSGQPGPALPRTVAQQPARHASFVSAAGYDPASKTLRLTFASSGNSYDYHGVPADVAREFLDADRKGTFFHHKIKGSYRAQRLERPE